MLKTHSIAKPVRVSPSPPLELSNVPKNENKLSSDYSEIANSLAFWESRSGGTASKTLRLSNSPSINPVLSLESPKSQVSGRPLSAISGGTPIPMPRASPKRKTSQELQPQSIQELKTRSPSCPNSPKRDPQPEGGHASRLEFIAAPGAQARNRSPVIAMVQNRITHQLQALSCSTSSSLAARAAREEREKELEALRSRKATAYGTSDKANSADNKVTRLTVRREGSELPVLVLCSCFTD